MVQYPAILQTEVWKMPKNVKAYFHGGYSITKIMVQRVKVYPKDL